MKEPLHHLARVLLLVVQFLLLTLTITMAGALVGMVLFLALGKLAGMDLTTTELVRNGLFDGGFFALIWAPGISFVTLFMRAYRKRQRGGRGNPQ